MTDDNTQAPDAALAEEVKPDAAAQSNDIAALTEELATAKQEVLYAKAETQNVRRRLEKDITDARAYAATSFARDMLSVADNLRRALDSLPESEAKDDRTRSLLAGVAATERELLAAFERHGLKRIDAKGEKFDHNFHQAVFEMENTGQPAGTVVEVLQPGYVLHDRLLRPAMVGVAKGGAPAVEPDGTDDGA